MLEGPQSGVFLPRAQSTMRYGREMSLFSVEIFVSFFSFFKTFLKRLSNEGKVAVYFGTVYKAFVFVRDILWIRKIIHKANVRLYISNGDLSVK